MGFTNKAVASMLESKLSSVDVALYISSPSDDGTGGTELTADMANGYVRKNAPLDPTVGAEKQYQNHHIIQFNIIREDVASDVTHVALFEPGTQNMIFYDQLTDDEGKPSPVHISENSIPVFDVGELIIGIDRPDNKLAPANPNVQQILDGTYPG